MKKFPAMVSMELDDEAKLDAPQPIRMADKPDYPYGLRICLTDAELNKLNLDASDAEVGGIFHMFALARVTSISSSDGPDGKCTRIEAQIEDLLIRSEDDENAESAKSSGY